MPVEPSIISDRICNADRLSFVRVIAELMVPTLVPTLVPKPGSPTVTQGKLTGHESTALRVLALPWLRPGREICSLKICVSAVRFRPWPPFQISQLGRFGPTSIVRNSHQVPIWCPLRRGTNRFCLILNVCFSQYRTLISPDFH